MGVDEAVVAGLAGKFAELLPHLDERRRRLYLGSEARALAGGGGRSLASAVAVVAAASGASRATVMAGAGELAEGAGLMPGRSRRPGAGRPAAGDVQPGLREALLEAAAESARGDPVAEVTWCSQSLRQLGARMAAAGFSCGKDAVARVLREAGYSLQGMAKVLEGSQHPDRDAQFRHVNARIAEFRAAGDPVVSVDAKKKELIGPYGRAGRQWRPAGDPVKARDHDFMDRQLGMITPYGVYDIAANRGFVSVGASHDTAAFAVAAIRSWWQREGSLRYRGAARLLVVCDAGGSNGCRCRLWKDQLAVLAGEAGLRIEVCHFPPGTSKWNKIEHRMFCHVTRTWAARPLMTREDAVAGIAATVTAQGLKCTAVLDDRDYPGGVKVSDERAAYLEDRVIERAAFHGDWNYAILPVPRPAPEPQAAPAAPAGPDQALLDALAALAGIPAPGALHDDVALEWAAAREHHLTLARGHQRRRASGNGGYTRLTSQAILTAAACQARLGMPWALLGRLLGVHYTSLSVPGNWAIPILGKHGITTPPASPRITTEAQLLQHAAAAGIPLTLHPLEPATQPQTTQPETRDTPETAN